MKLLLIAAVFPFQLLVVSSLSFYFGNQSEISFSVFDLWSLLFFYALVSSLFLAVFLYVFRNKKKIFAVLSGILVGSAICIWVQSQLMVWDFGLLDGRGVDWVKWQNHMLIEYALWLFVLAGTIFLFLRTQPILQKTLVQLVFFVGVLSIASSYLMSSPRADVSEKDSYTQVFKFHPENNVVVIMLDTFQSDYFEHILENYPADVKFFDGFTFYRNTISDHPTTAPNLPSIFTGKTYDNTVPFKSYIESAFSDFNLGEFYKRKGYDVDLISNPSSLPGAVLMRQVVDVMQDLNKNNLYLLLDFGFFRAAPTRFKSNIYNDGNWLLSKKLSGGYPPGIFEADARFVELFEQHARKSAEVTYGKFVFYHFMGAHAPWQLNENFEYDPIESIGDERYIRHARGALTLVSRMFSKLNDLGIYESSEIIVLGDHGTLSMGPLSHHGQSVPPIPATVHSSALPMFMHKKPFASGDIVINDSPLYLKDMSCLLRVNYSGLDCSEFARATQGEARSRKYMYYEWKHEFWQRDFMPGMIEYLVDGHAYDVNSWRIGEFEYDAGIKTKLSKYVTIGQPLFFTQEKSTKITNLLRTGLSWQEPNHRWTEGPKASMQFRVQDYAQRDLVLRLNANGYLGGGLPHQKVGVVVNGIQIAEWQVADAAEYTAVIPANLVVDDGLIDLSFDISDPRSPCDFGDPSDCRRLGIAVRELVVDYVQ
ncbi:sulfatase-like hydrolase/transferase [Vibrio cholerae]|uniref:sulfatase-like hydrolase/transferase n=1 Tax=Vibrio cholerae TaxID=666 RepID=UPI00226E5196|nr:sulfatase-like hydrolase/transferase [Vibrio cholerae]MCX9450336.1 sulfatase-like hydrolase/transferase [Vibrio cholerae]